MQNNLWGDPQCTRGWETRCGYAWSDKCTCNCNGENHGIAARSGDAPAGSNLKYTSYYIHMEVEIYKEKGKCVAFGTHKGERYSFEGATPSKAITKALKHVEKGSKQKRTAFQISAERYNISRRGV